MVLSLFLYDKNAKIQLFFFLIYSYQNFELQYSAGVFKRGQDKLRDKTFWFSR